MWFCSLENLSFCSFKFSYLLYSHKQFSFSFLLRKWKDDQILAWCDHKAITLWNGFQVWNNSWKMFFFWKQNSIRLGFVQNLFKRKMIDFFLDHFAEDSTERLFVFVMLTKCCIFAIKTELWLLSKLFIGSVSGEYRNFCWENF